MNDIPDPIIDMHVHVGLLGDEHPELGSLSSWYRTQLVYRIFLLYVGVDPDRVCDRTLREATGRVIETCSLDRVVCLALDPVYDDQGRRREDASHVWVDNDYILELQEEYPNKVRLGASVHPFDPDFEKRVEKYVDKGAVLLKWLPSAQQINLADARAGKAMKHLATVRPNGEPLPLLLHVGVEHAIPSSDPRTKSYDFLSWSTRDRISNFFRGRNRWHKPDLEAVHRNIGEALDAGATVIFAHCGLPYFALGPLRAFREHSDFRAVRSYLERNAQRTTGRCYADVSACCSPFRKNFFPAIRGLPAEYLVFGSDFPVPVFELSADLREALRDMRAVFRGRLERIIVPQDNLLDVNYRELRLAFPGHPMFTNFARLCPEFAQSG